MTEGRVIFLGRTFTYVFVFAALNSVLNFLVALGAIGVVDEKLIDVLLWSIRYERVPAVRAEACNAVAALGLRDERLLSVLQDRLVVETEDIVKRCNYVFSFISGKPTVC